MVCYRHYFILVNSTDIVHSAITVAAIRLELAMEEANELQQESHVVIVHKDCTASALVSVGLHLEEQQYVHSD